MYYCPPRLLRALSRKKGIIPNVYRRQSKYKTILTTCWRPFADCPILLFSFIFTHSPIAKLRFFSNTVEFHYNWAASKVRFRAKVRKIWNSGRDNEIGISHLSNFGSKTDLWWRPIERVHSILETLLIDPHCIYLNSGGHSLPTVPFYSILWWASILKTFCCFPPSSSFFVILVVFPLWVCRSPKLLYYKKVYSPRSNRAD